MAIWKSHPGEKLNVGPLAFYLGAHGIDPAPVKDQIEAKFTEDTLKEKEQPLQELHQLKAKLDHAREERPEAEAIWDVVRKDLGDMPPPYFHAVLMAIFGSYALLVDAVILAPTMDMIGVAEPAVQYVVAVGFAMLFTAWFELAGFSYARAINRTQKPVAVAAGCAAVLTLIVWGLMRGYQLQFAAGIAGNPLGQFLGAHPLLATVFFILITVATPMVGAFTFLSAWRDFSHARTWRRARKRVESVRKSEIELPKQIQAKTEWLEQFDRRKEAECRQWKESFNHYYERGRLNGALREPLWSVIWKAMVGGICCGILAFFVPSLSLISDCLLPVIPGVGLFLFFNYRRLHPSEDLYAGREFTRFANTPEHPLLNQEQEHRVHLLSKGGQK